MMCKLENVIRHTSLSVNQSINQSLFANAIATTSKQQKNVAGCQNRQ